MNVSQRLKELVNYAGDTVTGTRDPLVPPPWLHSVGNSGFRETGEEFLLHFINLCDLQPTERVLDVGSGNGRMAIHLANYLTLGTYDGIEIMKRSVDWCRKAYQPFPNFRFHHVNVFNGRYNPRGTPAAEYRFPFPDSSFDFVFLTSVFTHMLANDVEHYLHEIRRVLASDGRALITVFLLNPETMELINAGLSEYSFRHPIGGTYAETLRQPERATAYEEEHFRNMVADAGLDIMDIYPGMWAGRTGLSGQDIAIVTAGASNRRVCR